MKALIVHLNAKMRSDNFACNILSYIYCFVLLSFYLFYHIALACILYVISQASSPLSLRSFLNLICNAAVPVLCYPCASANLTDSIHLNTC